MVLIITSRVEPGERGINMINLDIGNKNGFNAFSVSELISLTAKLEQQQQSLLKDYDVKESDFFQNGESDPGFAISTARHILMTTDSIRAIQKAIELKMRKSVSNLKACTRK